jgi:AcrR family transcriptional regulator
MARSGEESRTALLDAAERLFAIHGVETTSLRDIAIAAGQRNNSATQYHFVDREGLVAAVFTRRMDEINERRIQMISDVDRNGQDGDIVALASALMFPLIEYVTTHDGWYGRFLLRTESDQFAKDVKNTLAAAVPVFEVMRRLFVLLDGLPSRVRNARIQQLMTHYISAVADWEWARDRDQKRLSPPELFDDVLATGCGILLAPARIELEQQGKKFS